MANVGQAMNKLLCVFNNRPGNGAQGLLGFRHRRRNYDYDYYSPRPYKLAEREALWGPEERVLMMKVIIVGRGRTGEYNLNS